MKLFSPLLILISVLASSATSLAISSNNIANADANADNRPGGPPDWVGNRPFTGDRFKPPPDAMAGRGKFTPGVRPTRANNCVFACMQTEGENCYPAHCSCKQCCLMNRHDCYKCASEVYCRGF